MTVGPAKLKTLYLILAIVGAIIPYAFFIQHINESGFGIGPRPWLFVALNLGIGLSCALLAYLYVNESRQQSAAT
ncbi:MAG: hypothetical protein OSB26_10220 [Woeseiaceae bacterium]|nr:hypothetical protein [Woeseiaceae bacterium]